MNQKRSIDNTSIENTGNKHKKAKKEVKRIKGYITKFKSKNSDTLNINLFERLTYIK